jgi:hypothetical protein
MGHQPAALPPAAGLQLDTDVEFLNYPFGSAPDAALGHSIISVLLKILQINRSLNLGKPSSASTAALQMMPSSFLLHQVSHITLVGSRF